jgi:uncharacterized protein (DUF1330 family)
MNVSNAVAPTPEQFQQFLGSDFTGPVCMVNLLKFKEMAEYADGRETDLTGQQAYNLYGEDMRGFVLSKGGRFIFYGAAEQLVIGTAEEEWDTVAIVEYPSKEALVEIATSVEVQGFGVHRSAGLAGQLLIATSQRNAG